MADRRQKRRTKKKSARPVSGQRVNEQKQKRLMERERLEQMSPKQRRRYIARRRQAIARKKLLRMMGGLLFLAVAVYIAFSIGKGKSDKAAEEEKSTIGQTRMGLPNAGAGQRNEVTALEGTANSSDDTYMQPAGEAVPIENGQYEGAVDISALLVPGAPLDVTKGQAAVDLSLVTEESIKKVQSAKAAMMQASYFQGTSQTVNQYLSAYGEGEWHGIQDVSGDICVFYEGSREVIERPVGADGQELEPVYRDVTFRILFTVYEDGSFQVIEVYEDGTLIDDYESYLMNIVQGNY